MTAFDQLHPAIQYHIVNSLGWSRLRPTQLEAIAPILANEDCLLLAPTAGGKTEAAVLPLMSRMLAESWSGLSVLYVCPIKALLNNLEPRLTRCLSLIGRRVGVWHGDLGASARRRLVAEPPDLLLITPESIEGVLTAKDPGRRQLFQAVRTVVIDELHAFAGDDRGWHLLALLGRLAPLAGARLQRIGLSATVGNPQALLRWLALGGPGRVIGEGGTGGDADVTIDFVGSIENAALVISRLHRGEKRLVFCDSRSRVETLAGALRSAGVRVFVSHSSLALEERRQAERAFSEAGDCVIVATSTLELGIDVGDLDRVIQIDAPTTVSSFLQRMGRTGRRPGTRRNCLFLTTTDEALLCSAALAGLWRQGLVEAVEPPVQPYPVIAQQLLARVLEARGARVDALVAGIQATFGESTGEAIGQILDHLRANDILWDDGGILWFGPRGERELGPRHFLALLSVFTSPLQVLVRHGLVEIGSVDPLSLRQVDQRPVVLQLGGRGWTLRSVDWARRVAQVEPAQDQGRTHWAGTGRALGFTLCQAVGHTLSGSDPAVTLSRRAGEHLRELRDASPFCGSGDTALVTDDRDVTQWWTFAGFGANAVLAQTLGAAGIEVRRYDNFTLTLAPSANARLPALLELNPALGCEAIWEPWMDRTELKFSLYLPESLARAALVARLTDAAGARRVLDQAVRNIRVHASDGKPDR